MPIDVREDHAPNSLCDEGWFTIADMSARMREAMNADSHLFS